jgi:hypothetical protein
MPDQVDLKCDKQSLLLCSQGRKDLSSEAANHFALLSSVVCAMRSLINSHCPVQPPRRS